MKSFGSSVLILNGADGMSKSASPELAHSRESDRRVEPTGIEAEFAADVIAGLSANEKTLVPKYFYDATGSDLFETICLTPEYYPTRTETALLKEIALEIAADIPDRAALVEFGSGASDKTRVILDAHGQQENWKPCKPNR